MRPVWYEYPNVEDTWAIIEEFFVGSSILYAPKLTQPTPEQVVAETQTVDYYLPEGSIWYDYQSGLASTQAGVWVTTDLADTDQAIFVKGGSILPQLNHNGCESLLNCINDGLTLKMYLDGDQQAHGMLYVDDGETFNFQLPD